MASLRDQILEELTARLAAGLTAEDGWTVSRKHGRDQLNAGEKVAFVVATTENVLTPDAYNWTKELLISVFIFGRIEDAGSTHAGNPLRYLDELVEDVERVIWSGGELTVAEQLRHQGLTFYEPEDSNIITAEVRLSVVYRHAIGDPSVYPGTVVL